MENLEEKTISTDLLYSGKVVSLKKDEVLTSDNEVCFREVVLHKGGVVVLPYFDKDHVILIKQWRYPIGKAIFELPAGKLDKPNEDKFSAIKRELKEETGFIAQNWEYLGEIYTSPGFTNEKLFLYKADNLTSGHTEFDEFEKIETHIFSIDEIKKMIKSGDIQDSKTLCAFLYAGIGV